jgi:primase-polymerase (primpol)-like protein
MITGAMPEELRALRQWVVWRSAERDGKTTKIPFQPRPGQPRRMASTTNPDTWGTFEQALAAQQATGADGMGFVFTAEDPFTGIDVDDCFDSTGVIHPEALAIVKSISSYVERSPSGRGLHLIVRGKLNGARHRTSRTPWGGVLEVYDRSRYFTMTGRGKGEIADRQDQLDQLVTRMLPPAPAAPACCSNGHVDLDDRELLERAFAARNGAKVQALWRGDTSSYGGDHSAADLALCSALAFWVGDDHDRLDRLFRGSLLMREKWNSPRGESTYGRQTIALALAGRADRYQAPGSASAARECAA